MRIVSSIVCSLIAGAAGAQPLAPSWDELLSMPAGARTLALQSLRTSGDLAALEALDFAASAGVEARRAAGTPPLSPGCQRPDEFDVSTQLRLARRAPDVAGFVDAMRSYQELTSRLDSKLATARQTDEWRRQFGALKVWEEQWREARDPRTRELLRRTLGGQAIRAALARAKLPAVTIPMASPRAGMNEPRRTDRRASKNLVLTAYREYIFNLMCIEDEVNLTWFKQQIVEIGWFGKRQFGWAADRAALLLVQHADADPDFQKQVADSLESRLETGDTDPENFAYLVDRVAVRAGRPQRFGTQIECVQGKWVAPEIESRDTLDARRDRVNLVAYDVQIARMSGMCSN